MQQAEKAYKDLITLSATYLLHAYLFLAKKNIKPAPLLDITKSNTEQMLFDAIKKIKFYTERQTAHGAAAFFVKKEQYETSPLEPDSIAEHNILSISLRIALFRLESALYKEEQTSPSPDKTKIIKQLREEVAKYGKKCCKISSQAYPVKKLTDTLSSMCGLALATGYTTAQETKQIIKAIAKISKILTGKKETQIIADKKELLYYILKWETSLNSKHSLRHN